MKKHIFVINGYPRSGKDEFVNQVGNFTNVENYSTVDSVKLAAMLLGWDGEKDEEGRKFIHELKMMSVKYYDNPYKAALDRIDAFQDGSIDAEIMFIHSREPEEVERFAGQGFRKILITERGQSIDNPADSRIMETDYDFIIFNDGTIESLYEKAKDFVDSIGLNKVVRNV